MTGPRPDAAPRRDRWIVWLAWAAVGLPFAWGVYETVKKAAQLFS